jgi:thioredoxin reductase (NADPH)
MSKRQYDVIIIGGGPAGLSAGIYTARARLKTLMIEKGAVGGAIINAGWVENYPGFAEGISGIDLTQAMHRQATGFGMETAYAEVTGLKVAGEERWSAPRRGITPTGWLSSPAAPSARRWMSPARPSSPAKAFPTAPTCDGAFLRDKVVAVIGGGDAAVTEALELTKFATRSTSSTAATSCAPTKSCRKRPSRRRKIEFIWASVVVAIKAINSSRGCACVMSGPMRNRRSASAACS